MAKIIRVEFSKYRRTIISWAIALSVFMTALLGVLMAMDSGNVSLRNSMVYGLGWLNLLSLLLLALLTGMVFSGEYSQGTARVMFTYPIARWKLFLAKLIVLFCWTIFLFVLYLLISLVVGLVFGASLPDVSATAKAMQLILSMPILNFAMVPITALISIRTCWYGSFTLSGAAYVVIYITLIRSNARFFLPMTIPNVIKDYFLGSESLTSTNWICMIVSLCIIIAATTIAGLFNYRNRDV